MNARPEPARTPRRLLGFALGVALLVGACWAALSSQDTLTHALHAVQAAPPWLIAFLLAVPALSWLASSGALWALTRRHGSVGAGEMAGLVASAWMLNYLPLKPGMIGRLAYHKRVNNVPVRASVRVLVESVAMTAAAAAVVFAIALALRGAVAPAWTVALAVAAPVSVPAAWAWATRQRGAWYALAATFRYLDMLVWVGRYAAVFHAVGEPLPLTDAVLIASASQLAIIVPLTGNGLGVREWAVGLTAGAAGAGLGLALAADLVNRAAEILVSIPIGLLGARAVARRYSRRAQTPSAPSSDGSCGPNTDPVDTNGNTPPPPS